MWLLGFFLVPVALAANIQLNINSYVVNIEDDVLKSVRKTQDQASNELDLSGRGLEDIDKNAFDNLEQLKKLDLSNNSLSSLPEFVFSNLTHLERLSLADNDLGVFPAAFAGLNNLKSLNISNNPLAHLRRGYFFGLTKACDILSEGNAYYYISSEVFKSPFVRSADVEIVRQWWNGGTPGPDSAQPIQPINLEFCIQNGTVNLVDLHKDNEPYSSGCRQGTVLGGGLMLPGMGISDFEPGWYRPRGVNVRSLILDQNNIVRVTGQLLNDLPEEVVSVGLTRNKIERLEKGIIANSYLRSLWLSNNLISEIDDDAFAGTNLTELNLAGNRIKTMKFVATLPSTIVQLDLYRNQIAELMNISYAKFYQLTEYDLRYNNITEVKRQSFRDLSNVKVLHLTNNGLKKIEPGAFRSITGLTELWLNDNEIDNLEAGVFAGLETIKKISLAGNKLTSLTRDTMKEFPESLEVLYLDYNAITTSLKSGTFVNVPKFRLSLEGNKIPSIEKGSFDLPTLQELNLKNNSLNAFDGDSFEGLASVKRLELKRNNIKKIEKGAMKNLASVGHLDIGNNPIEVLANGALFGLATLTEVEIYVANDPITLIQGGLFDDV